MSAARILFAPSLQMEPAEGALSGFLTPDVQPTSTTTAEEEAANRPDFLKFILGVTGIDTALDLVGKATSTAPQQAAARQMQQSQRLEAARSEFVIEQRGELWASVAPWAFLAVGVLGVSVILGVAAVRKRS